MCGHLTAAALTSQVAWRLPGWQRVRRALTDLAPNIVQTSCRNRNRSGSCSHHWRPSGLPLNPGECGISRRIEVHDRLSVELIVRVLACLAEGLGIRATARVLDRK